MELLPFFVEAYNNFVDVCLVGCNGVWAELYFVLYLESFV